MRYRNKHNGNIQFIEVDLPSVVEGKQKLYDKYLKQEKDTMDFEPKNSNFVPFDLNECGGNTPKSLIDVLSKNSNFRTDVPTMFVFEAVLFYVEEDAIRNIMNDLSTFMTRRNSNNPTAPEALLCMTGKC